MKNCFYKGKSAVIITGATGVIGKALAKHFAANILEKSTLLLSSRNKLRLRHLKAEILKLRPDIKVETVVWNLETPDYDLFFSDIKKSFGSNHLSNQNELNHSDISYCTAIIIHNATDVGDVDKTVIEHGKNPQRIQKILNVNTVSLISLTSAFAKYFNYFKTKKIVVEMLPPTSRYPFPSFGHISMKCANKMVLDILSQEEDGKLKILHYNPVAVDTENLRKIKNFSSDESIRDAFDILYKTKKLINPDDVSRNLFDIVNNNKFFNGSIVNFGEEINNNNEVEEDFDITTQLKAYQICLSENNENKSAVKVHDYKNFSKIVDNNIGICKSLTNKNCTSSEIKAISRETDNVNNSNLIDIQSEENFLASSISKIEENFNMTNKINYNDMDDVIFKNSHQIDTLINNNITSEENFSNRKLNSNNCYCNAREKKSKPLKYMNMNNKFLENSNDKRFKENMNIKLFDDQKDINRFPGKRLTRDNIKNDVTVLYHFNRNSVSSDSKTCHGTIEKEKINSELDKFEVSKPKTFYQEYKDIYFNEKLHSPQNVVVPNSSSFKIIKSFYDRSKNQTSNYSYKHDEIFKNFKKDTYKNTNKAINKKEASRTIKTSDNRKKIYSNIRNPLVDKKCESKLDLGIPKQSIVEKVTTKENANGTFLVKGTGQNKIYIINGVVYHIEGAFRRSINFQ